MASDDMRKRGGHWLAVARTWLQNHRHNGGSVTWGSNEELRPAFTAREAEDFAGVVAQAAYEMGLADECKRSAAFAREVRAEAIDQCARAAIAKRDDLNKQRDAMWDAKEREQSDYYASAAAWVQDVIDDIRALKTASHARLDTDRTAQPKTVLTAPVRSGREGTQFAGPATAIVDTETGKRTELYGTGTGKEPSK